MSIHWEILGSKGEDNALLVTVDTGHSQSQLLFDCGEGCLSELRISSIQSIEHLFFSHFHMDHVSGFDTFFRHNYNRPNGIANVWGPADTIEVMTNRFRGYTWNLHHDQPGEWMVHELSGNEIRKSRFLTRNAFLNPESIPPQKRKRCEPIFSSESFAVDSLLLPHGDILSAAYRVNERARSNIDPAALQETGLTPGVWLQHLSDNNLRNDSMIEVDGKEFPLGSLREKLLTTSPGASLAYLTDFRVEPDTPEWKELVEWLSGTNHLICECQYRKSDELLAKKNGHMTSELVGKLAKEARVGRVTLIHLSRRYDETEWAEMESEVRAEFPRSSLP